MRTKRGSFHLSLEQTKGKSKKTFIFLHDIGFDRRMWLPALTEIGKRHAALSYDLRGFGANSSADLSIATIDEHCDDLFYLLRKKRIKEPVLIAHHFGSHIALRAAEREPDRIRGLCVGGFLPFVADGDEASAKTMRMRAILEQGSKVFSKEFVSQLIIDHNNSAKLIEHVQSHGDMAIVAALRALLTRTNHRSILSSFRHPLYIVCGEHEDALLYRQYLVISVGIEHARCIRIPESNLLPPLENPAAYNRVIMRFLGLFESR